MRIPIAPEGWPFIVPAIAGVGILALVGWWGAAAVLAVPAIAFTGFFRDPHRLAPHVSGGLLAPADGKVMGITEVNDPWVGPALRISIFLSPLDVHINRAPMAGVVRAVERASGRFLAAYRSEASEENERCSLALEGDSARVVVRQIAGVLARRIVCRVRRGDKLDAGERFGLIRFGSRTDLIMPRSADVRVAVGARVRGGESIMAVLR